MILFIFITYITPLQLKKKHNENNDFSKKI